MNKKFMRTSIKLVQASQACRGPTTDMIGRDLRKHQVKGTFLEFQTSGDYWDMFNQLPELKYNPYFGVRAVGVIHVDEVYSASAPLPGRRIVPPDPYMNPMEE